MDIRSPPVSLVVRAKGFGILRQLVRNQPGSLRQAAASRSYSSREQSVFLLSASGFTPVVFAVTGILRQIDLHWLQINDCNRPLGCTGRRTVPENGFSKVARDHNGKSEIAWALIPVPKPADVMGTRLSCVEVRQSDASLTVLQRIARVDR